MGVGPGVPSFCAAAARLGKALCEKSERLMVVPASHGSVEDCLELDANLVFMKAGRELGALKRTLAEHDLLASASLADLPEDTGYFSIVLVKKP